MPLSDVPKVSAAPGDLLPDLLRSDNGTIIDQADQWPARRAEIAAHLGEVLWAQGKRDQAMAIWREGLQLNADNETLLETLKRLRVKL